MVVVPPFVIAIVLWDAATGVSAVWFHADPKRKLGSQPVRTQSAEEEIGLAGLARSPWG